MKKYGVIFVAFLIVLVGSAWLWGSATYKWNVTPGLSIGDILYADRGGASSRLTDLDIGLNGQTLQVNSGATAPQWVAKNTYRQATIHNFATLAASWTLSSDEALCFILAGTNANAANTINGPATEGKIFYYRNATGQATQFKVADGGTGVSITNAKKAWLMYDSVTGDYIKMGSEF